ncbi:MAG: hypothetical protein ACLFPL_02710 [Candidatus Nanoarchaeia archaeon]
MRQQHVSTLFFNKNAALTTQKIVVFILVLFVFIFLARPAGEVVSTYNLFGEDQLEQACKTEGYRQFSTNVYCEKERESEINDPDNFAYFCSEEATTSNGDQERRDEQQIERYERIAQDLEDEENCKEVGDEGCSCVMNAFLYQQNEAHRILDEGEGSDDEEECGILCGNSYQAGEEFEEKQNSLLSSDEDSYYSLDSYTSSDSAILNIPFTEDDIEGNEIILAHLEEQYNSRQKAQQFIAKTNQISKELNTDPRFLISIMAFETGDEFGSCTQNPQSSATGLIQFLESTANGLGTSTSQLCQMDELEQLDYVKQYFQSCSNCRNNLDKIEKVYTAVFYGRARDDLDSVLYREGSSEYRVNDGLDTRFGNNDGAITVKEVALPVKQKYQKYFGSELTNEGTSEDISPDLLSILNKENPTLSKDLRDAQVSDSSFNRLNYEIGSNTVRKYGLNPDLELRLQTTAEETGVNVYIYSGGQPSQGRQRIGSHRHDFGNAADLYITYNGEKVCNGNPKFDEFVRVAFRNGIQAGGSSPSYMGNCNMHLDIVGTRLGGGVYWSSTQNFVDALTQGINERESTS